MKIADMDPRVTMWADGRSRKVGNWSYDDWLSDDGVPLRTVCHYTTVMVVFGNPWGRSDVADEWEVRYLSVGNGSVSDQGGVNQLVGSYGFRYRRDARGGGARVESVATGVVVAD